MTRIVVRVEEHPMAGPVGDRIRWIAVCATTGCTWRSRYQVVKTAATEEARWHRDQHRDQHRAQGADQ